MHQKGGFTIKKLLIIVDFQNDFIDGALGFEKAELLIAPIKDKILDYQKHHHDIIYTLDTHQEDYLTTLEGSHLPVKHCLLGTKGHELQEDIKALIEDYPRFIKDTFPSLELGTFLRNQPYEVIELVGLVSHICVLSNAIIAKAANPNAKIIIDQNCTASFDETLEDKAFDVLEGLHITVIRRQT